MIGAAMLLFGLPPVIVTGASLYSKILPPRIQGTLDSFELNCLLKQQFQLLPVLTLLSRFRTTLGLAVTVYFVFDRFWAGISQVSVLHRSHLGSSVGWGVCQLRWNILHPVGCAHWTVLPRAGESRPCNTWSNTNSTP